MFECMPSSKNFQFDESSLYWHHAWWFWFVSHLEHQLKWCFVTLIVADSAIQRSVGKAVLPYQRPLLFAGKSAHKTSNPKLYSFLLL